MSWTVLRHDVASPPPAPDPAERFQAVITSPPYWGLRDYSRTAGPEPVPPSDWPEISFAPIAGLGPLRVPAISCRLGEEPDPWAYVAHLVHAFRGLRDSLREDGTLWLNLGDTYSRNPKKGDNRSFGKAAKVADLADGSLRPTVGLPEGNLFGIPWRVAFALQADGWILRSDVIWVKPNANPESVQDRPTRAHEFFFVLARRRHYYYDSLAIKDPVINPDSSRYNYRFGGEKNESLAEANRGRDGTGGRTRCVGYRSAPTERNKRTAWLINTRPYKGAHYAAFPPGLVEPPILAGTSEKGRCPKCGAPWVRRYERDRVSTRPGLESKVYEEPPLDEDSPYRRHNGTICGNRDPARHVTTYRTIGWEPGCSCRGLCDCGSADVTGQFIGPHAEFCPAGKPFRPVPCRVLDPFVGSGTTIVVAEALGRDGVGWDVNPEYIKDVEHRCSRPCAPPRRLPRGRRPAGPSLFPEEP